MLFGSGNGLAVRRRLRGQPDPGVPRQRACASPCSTCSGCSAPTLTLTALSLLTIRWMRASRPQRREVTWVLAGGKRDAARADRHGRRRPARQPAQLGAGEGLVPHARRSFRSRSLATFVRRRLARGSVAGLVVQLGGPDGARRPAGGAGPRARRPLAGPRVLVPGRGSLRDRRRPPGGAAGRRQQAALDVRRARRARRSRCCSTTRRSSTTRSSSSRCAPPRASRSRTSGSRPSCGRGWSSCTRRGGGWSRRRTPSAAGSSATCTTGRSSGWSRSRCRSGCSSRSWPRTRASAGPIVREARSALALALEELRELTQGIHPTLLVERGLPVALEELCRRAGLPAHLEVDLDVPPSRPGRDRRLLLRERGAEQRRQALARQRGPGRGRRTTAAR